MSAPDMITERTETGYSAYSPDIPGCVAAGETEDEALQLLREAIEEHLKSDISPSLSVIDIVGVPALPTSETAAYGELLVMRSDHSVSVSLPFGYNSFTSKATA